MRNYELESKYFKEIDVQRVARERERVLRMMLETEINMAYLKSLAAKSDMRPESRFELDVRKHTPRFDLSRMELVGKLDYFYTPYLHGKKEPLSSSPGLKYYGPFSSKKKLLKTLNAREITK